MLNMGTYIGTKMIKARPMSRFEAETYHGVKVGGEKEGAGYLVKYPDGYLSWSPKDVFEKAYRHCDTMTFGLAIEAMKQGKKVTRKGWNGKNMWITLMSGMSLPPFSCQTTKKKVNDRTAKLIGENTPLVTLPYIAIWTADKKWQPGWFASQTDMLSEDWVIINK